MAKEIERKFLIDNKEFSRVIKEHSIIPYIIAQGYLLNTIEKTIRVRLKGDKGYLTIKGQQEGIERTEFEYSIPAEEAKELLTWCKDGLIEKLRYEYEFEGKLWEIDVFKGNNEGLFVAEVELSSAKEHVKLPHWVTKEVSEESKYTNAALVKHPFSEWG